MHAPATNEPFSRHPFAVSADRLLVEQNRSMVETASRQPEVPAPGPITRFSRMIARRFATVVIVTLLSIIAAATALQFMTPLYTSSAQVMIQRITANNLPPSADDRLRMLRNEQELIVSTPVLASALSMPAVHDISPLRGHPDALKLIKQQIRVDSGRGDDLINVSYDAADPREGTRLLSAVVDAYVRFRSGLHETSVDGSTATVLAEKQKAVASLKQKRADLQAFSTEHGLAAGNEQVDEADEVMHELGERLALARVETVSARSAYDQMQHDLANDPRMVERLAQSKDNDSSLADGDEQAIAKQIIAAQTQLAGFGNKFMANYAPVQLLHRKIDDLKFTRDCIIQQRWQRAVRAEAEMQASFDQEQTAAAAGVANEQAFDQRKEDVGEAEKQIAILDKQLKDLESANKLITTMVTVIEPPAASDRPTKPRSALIVMIAAMAGLLLGCGIAGIRDARSENETVGESQSLGAGLPVLARLPAVPRRQLAMSSWRDRMVDSAAEFAEACRKVHVALEAVTSFSGGRTVLVTSTNVHEGKSTLASLLALTLAQTDKRVLLVDANLHAPMQGRIFGIEGEYGLGQLLEEEIESSFVSYVHPGGDPRMDILMSGSADIAIPDLLNSPRFTNLMAAMASEYDYVLIDSPALSAGPDARIIASSCDATIVLASESSLNRKATNKTRDSLTSVGGNVIGVVINGGMPAIATQAALANLEPARVSAPPRPSVQVTTVRLSPPVEEVQSVVAAQVRRAEDPAPQVTDNQENEGGNQWIWSYLLMLALLVGGWMAFQSMWGFALTKGAVGKSVLSGRTALSEPSVLVQQEPVAMLMAAGGLLVVLALSGFNVKPPRHEIAVVIASAALAAWSFHGGAVNTLLRAQQHDFAPYSASQAVLLFASLALGWSIVRRATAERNPIAQPNSLADVAVAIFAGASAMSALMILLSHWQTKGECLAVITFSACLATMLAYWMAPLRSSLSFWIAPMLVALFGYVCAMMGTHGVHVGILTSLARPLPMDYASMGPIGAVLGFWIARSASGIVRTAQLAVD